MGDLKVLPTNPKSDILEEESMQFLKKEMSPWVVHELNSKAPSIDAYVEITSKDNEGDHELTGKRFPVQLKARTRPRKSGEHITVSIEKKYILNWFMSNEPVLFVLYHVSEKSGYYIFIDDAFKDQLNQYSPKWKSQKTISIRIPIKNLFGVSSQNIIEKYILRVSANSSAEVAPGTFFKLKSLTLETIQSFTDTHKSNSVGFIDDYLNDLIDNTKNAIYTVAVIGPSRSGKSTLVNALMAQPISPVGKLPTTGVPFKIQPGKENYSEILFQSGKQVKGKATSDYLSQYVSQKDNEDNYKKVKYVNVFIESEQMEQGLALVDVPGLDDPSSTIRNLALSEIISADAIIYQVDVAPYKYGNFKLTKDDIEQLLAVRRKSDRLFLVANKIDALEEEELNEVRDYIEKQLTKYEIMEFLSHPPLFLSAKNAYEAESNEEKESSGVKALEDHIWTYLLSNNKTGLHRLKEQLGNFQSELTKLRTILKIRLSDQSKRTELEKLVSDVEVELRNFTKFSRDQGSSLLQWLKQEVDHSKFDVLDELKTYLQSASEQQMVSKKEYQDYLEKNAVHIVTELYSRINDYIYGLALEANQWIQSRLEQTEIQFEEQTKSEINKHQEIQKIIAPIQKAFMKPSVYSANNAVESILTGIGGAVHWFLEQLWSLFTSVEKRRKNRIDEIMKQANKSYTESFGIAFETFRVHVQKEHKNIISKIQDRSDVYINDLKQQIGKLEKPLNEKDKNIYLVELDQIQRCLTEIDTIGNQLESVIKDGGK